MTVLLYTNEERCGGKRRPRETACNKEGVHTTACKSFSIYTSRNTNVFPLACRIRKGKGKREITGSYSFQNASINCVINDVRLRSL
jgi:hypothetical protein